jgi:hypothetical protein
MCNKTSECLNAGAVCNWIAEANSYGCDCPAGTYFSLVDNSCTSSKQLGQICKDTTECTVNATCLWQTSTSDMRCQCTISTYYQNDTKTCLFLKGLNDTCSSSAQCQIKSGLFCLSGTCQCDSSQYWNGIECQTKKTYNSYNLYSSMFCLNNYECKDSVGLTNCYSGYCRCSPTKAWNGNTCV